MSVLRRDTAESTVIAVIEDLIQDWGLELSDGVNASTRVVADLEFASVDIIQLCVALEECYARKFGFQALLMRDGRYVSDLTVAQISQFIEARLSEPAGVSP
ncbi:MAG: acyl carrier protein [Rubrivivax sp.]|jgi:acyl carrier protein|nr:acyl carrier protein [Rubrivivax sp.]